MKETSDQQERVTSGRKAFRRVVGFMIVTLLLVLLLKFILGALGLI